MAPGSQNQMPGRCRCIVLQAARARVLVLDVPPRAAPQIYYLLFIIYYLFSLASHVFVLRSKDLHKK